MGRPRVLPILLVVLLCGAIAGPAVAAPAADLPFRFNPALDGKPVFATDAVSGTVWSAWAYRSRGEYDIAVASREPAGVWNEPTLLGRLDGLDQFAPALVSDASGNIFLAFAVRQTTQVFLAVLPHGGTMWSVPACVTSPGERAFSPSLAVANAFLVLGYRNAEGKVMLRGGPLVGAPVVSTNGLLGLKVSLQDLIPANGGIVPTGIFDSPDGTDPLGLGTTSPGTGSGTGSGTGTGNGTTGVGPG